MELKRDGASSESLVCSSRSRCAPSALAQRFITVASTTSTEQSGLFKHLLPMFEQKTGIEVRVVALGTGQALDLARRGDADVVFVHAKAAEEQFLREGHGVRRFPVMYNDFVIIGPKADPAGIAGGTDTLDALLQDQERRRAVRVARRPQRHAHRRGQPLDDGRRRHRQGKRPVVSRDRARHGAGAEHRVVDECVRARRSSNLARLQESRRARDSRRRRHAAHEPVRRHARESRRSTRT